LLNLHQQIISFGLKCDDFHAVIDGTMMDVNTDICAPHAITLERYCDRVDSAVRRLSVRVFGMQRDDGIALAHHLGRALQSTNILRDIDEDAAIGRVYLPREALLQSALVLARRPPSPRIPQFQRFAQTWPRRRKPISRLPRLSCAAARANGYGSRAAAAYHAILMRLLARGWAKPRYPVKVPTLQQIGILLRWAFI
jgi:phytoene synthase